MSKRTKTMLILTIFYVAAIIYLCATHWFTSSSI